jgi:membrane associated rhomboid family serine protease
MLPLRDNVPTRSFPLVTVGLIAANAAVWFWELGGTSVAEDVYRYGYYPCSLAGPCVPPASQVDHLPWYDGALSSMFMHGSWEHIVGNMLFLWIFGNNVEDALGRVRFVVFYLLGGFAATTLQTWVTFHWGQPGDTAIPNVGASGAISAVLGGYLLLLPTASVLTIVFYFFVEVPAVLFLGFWIFFQLWQGGYSIVHPEAGGGVAFFAHVGGFLFGLLAVRLFKVRDPLPPGAPRIARYR